MKQTLQVLGYYIGLMQVMKLSLLQVVFILLSILEQLIMEQQHQHQQLQIMEMVVYISNINNGGI